MESYKNLKVWQKTLDFIDEVYNATKAFSKDETYGLIGQIRSAAVSVAANIAEGSVKRSKKEYVRFLNIS
jgi:four helix bundle protein